MINIIVLHNLMNTFMSIDQTDGLFMNINIKRYGHVNRNTMP